MSPTPEQVKHAEALRRLLDDPPEPLAPLAFMYRQGIAARQAAERKLADLTGAHAAARSELERALGAERALHDALCAMWNAAPPTDPDPQPKE